MWLMPTLVMQARLEGAAGCHPLDLVEVVHPELAHEDLGVLRRPEHRERKPDEVVVVARRRVGAALRANACGEHLLRGGLAHRARDAHDEPVRMRLAPGAGEPQQKLLAVVSLGAQDGAAGRRDLGEFLRRELARRDDRRRALGGRRGKVGVSVDALAREGDEDGALPAARESMTTSPATSRVPSRTSSAPVTRAISVIDMRIIGSSPVLRDGLDAHD